MTAYTSSQTGPWSSASTWGGVGVPASGDTASIGAHTVTVDVNTTVGTSPNDTTTKVVNLTSASSILKVAAGITHTVLGNRGAVNGSTFQQEAGSTVTFDNSGSGGTPVYNDINVGFTNYTFNGTVGNLATIQAISGQTFKPNANWAVFTAAYAVIRRCSNLTITSISGNVSIANSLFDTCAKFIPNTTSTTANFTLDNSEFLNGTDTSNDLTLNFTGASSSGTRRLSFNKFDKSVLYTQGKLLDIVSNYIGGGLSCSAGVTFATAQGPRLNFFCSDGTLNAGNGAVFPGSFTRNYHVVQNSAGNPHFTSPTALLGADNIAAQNIFESQCPDLVDSGDCMIVQATACSGGNTVVARNNIALPSGYTGATVTSGCILTLFNADSAVLFQGYHSTANVDLSAVTGRQGAFDIAEANTGFAGQVSALKANVAWGSTASQGWLGMRVSGNVKDIITAAGDDYNWRFNTSDGDNQRGYEDKVASNTLWTAGDAVAAGVDVHQGTTDPQWLDKTRNVAVWCAARGYGAATFAAGKAALRADPSRTADLIDYVFEGFKSQNAAMRTSGYDGACTGAANYAKPGRAVATIAALRATFNSRYAVSV